MKVLPTPLEGVLIVVPTIHEDVRGTFLEAWNQEGYAAHGIGPDFLQDNRSCSVARTLRGMHAQTDTGKLVSVTSGEIFDVAADIRPASPTFGRWFAERLSDSNARQLWIPPGFAHGFCVLSDEARVEYKCTRRWDPTEEVSIAWNDSDLAIDWPIDDPILSDKDRVAPGLHEALSDFVPLRN